ncbi:MAG: lipoate--protein ligase [Saccharofermentanales bacterium]
MKYFISDTNDTAYNVALEDYAFNNLTDVDEIFMLWINEPSIIIGKNQNALAEINSDFVKENNIRVIRRISGGGAVYHDLNNLNFTLIAPRQTENAFDFKAFSQPVIRTLAKLGITATFSGRNDIEIDGQKFCGNAQAYSKDRVLHHGCLMFDVDVSVLSNALNVKETKIKSKGIKSVRSRVTNIKQHLTQEMTINDFKQALFDEMKTTRPDLEPYVLSEADQKAIQELAIKKASWEWNYGRAPAYDLRKELKYSFGNIEVLLETSHSILKQVTFYGDFFGVRDVTELAEELKDLTLEESAIKTRVESLTYPVSDYFTGLSNQEFCELLLP